MVRFEMQADMISQFRNSHLFVGSISVFISSALVLFGMSCKNITESDTAYHGEIQVYSSALEELGTIPVTDSPECILVYSGHILVATREGYLLDYDSESLEKLGEYQVGPASTDGYSQMTYNPANNSIYLIGAYGSILEIDLPEYTVSAVFSVCEAPVNIVSGGDNSEFLYVTDGINNKVIRVLTSINTISGSLAFNENIRAMAHYNQDTLLVSTTTSTYFLFEIATNYLISPMIYGDGAQGMSSVLNEDYTVTTFGEYIGVLIFKMSPDSTDSWVFDRRCPVEGIVTELKCDGVSKGFLLNYSGNSTARIYSYNYTSGCILEERDLKGFPLDMDVSPSGNVFLLMAFD